MRLEKIRAFLAGAGLLEFSARGWAEVYGWGQRLLMRYVYAKLGNADKGVLRRYVAQMTGLSRAQVTRLIAAYERLARISSAQI